MDFLHFALEGVDGLLEWGHHCAQGQRAAFLQGPGLGFENFVRQQLELLGQAGLLLREVGNLAGMTGLALVQFGL
ncbi:hypothetical protein D3C78_1028630 [compost metagenome]